MHSSGLRPLASSIVLLRAASASPATAWTSCSVKSWQASTLGAPPDLESAPLPQAASRVASRSGAMRSRRGVVNWNPSLGSGRDSILPGCMGYQRMGYKRPEREMGMPTLPGADDLADRPLRLSVLDQAPIADGSTGGEALRNSIDLARWTEQLGYHRYWVAEHHATPMLACASPEVL